MHKENWWKLTENLKIGSWSYASFMEILNLKGLLGDKSKPNHKKNMFSQRVKKHRDARNSFPKVFWRNCLVEGLGEMRSQIHERHFYLSLEELDFYVLYGISDEFEVEGLQWSSLQNQRRGKKIFRVCCLIEDRHKRPESHHDSFVRGLRDWLIQ